MAEKVLANNYFKGNFVTNHMANNNGKINVVVVTFLPMAVSGQVFTPLGQQYLSFLSCFYYFISHMYFALRQTFINIFLHFQIYVS